MIRLATITLRLGLAFVFAYPAVAGFMNPRAYAAWVPGFVLSNLPVGVETFLVCFFIFEAFLVLWLLSGRRTFWAAIVSALLIALITIPNLASIAVLFRNVGLFAAAAALAALEKR